MKPIRIGMWSGPRNLSTAMMRAFSSRPDTFTSDEPFYAHFLKITGVDHPGRQEVFQTMQDDWRRVADYLTGPIPDDRMVWYQKQMTHHVVGDMDLAWTRELVNCFLIRHPRDVMLSYQKIYPRIDVELLGCRQQSDLFDLVSEDQGTIPIVIDAEDIASRPWVMLDALCQAIGIPFTDAMLSWPQGPHPNDGVWGKYWYENVMKTSGFRLFKPKQEDLDAKHGEVYDECLACYEKLRKHRLC